jgi:non-ribosomal peptide synthetase component F
MFNLLMEYAEEDSYRALVSLRYVFLGGEALFISRLPWLRSPFCNAQIVNTYGPTEATDVVTSFRVTEPERYTRDMVPIGTPIYNTQIHILDPAGRLVPVGLPGELCIAGEGVGAGYIGQPEMTGEKFIPNPFAGSQATGNGKLYRNSIKPATWPADCPMV